MYVCVCIGTKAHGEVSKGEKAYANDDESKGNAVRVAVRNGHTQKMARRIVPYYCGRGAHTRTV